MALTMDGEPLQEMDATDLYELGVTRYLDKTDFNIGDWLDPDELARYNELTGDEATGDKA